MSLWQRAQSSLFMKKFEGTGAPVFVSPEDGKNGPRGPWPSPSMLAGASAGFAIGWRGGKRSEAARAPAAATASRAAAVALARTTPAGTGRRRRSPAARASSAPRATRPTCA